MSRRFIPFTRLSIVFILAMVLSGGVLTYFSINNISNLKELTEKRILEDQQVLATRFSSSLNKRIEHIAAGLIPGDNPVDFVKDSLIMVTAGQEYMKQAFVIDKNGQFIVPHFKGISEQNTRSRHSQEFTTDFELGEHAEFAEKDPGKARIHYLSCLDEAAGKEDSVMVLNALGRVAVKMEQIDDANAYYGSLIKDFSHLSDRNGFPYAYYALSHLLTQARPHSVKEITPVIASCLEQMKSGSIPLNFQSQEMLTLASTWLEENSNIDSLSFSKMHSAVSVIGQQIEFINQYRNEITEMAQEANSRKRNNDLSSVEISTRNRSNEPEFLLYKRDSAYTSGFLIDQNTFFDALINTGLQDGNEFEYLFSFPTEYPPVRSEDHLSYSAQLNPYFPDQILLIQILDKDLIPDLIKRRSWLYGTASFLLLVTMLFGIILILRDIAREKHVANLRSDFISNVTHELKTPLTSIRMYAESLMMGRMKSIPGQRNYLSVIVNESERLKRMINNILEFSKMEKSRQEYHMVEIDISEILQRAILDMRYWLDKEGFKLKTEIKTEIKAVIDPEKMYRVFSNLLSNAIKYSGDSRNIFIRLYSKNDSVVIEVEDEGIGIAKDHQAKIFEDFYRVENHESGNITGTGLGLTVVKDIVEAHRGRIEVESEIGRGSKFSVILSQT